MMGKKLFRISNVILFFYCFTLLISFGCDNPDKTGSLIGDSPITITGVTPPEAKAGEEVTITGTDFGESQGTSSLTIGGITATAITSWNSSEIKTSVPTGALTGPVQVHVRDRDSDTAKLIVLWNDENPSNVAIGICTDPNNVVTPMNSHVLSDGFGGAFIVWNDFRNYDPTPPDDPLPPLGAPAATATTSGIDIYIQRINSSGIAQWQACGIPVSTAAGGQYFPQLVSDGAGGSIVVWEDYRGGIYSDIYAQRVSSSGAVIWETDVAISAAAYSQEKPQIVSDGSGGAIIVWQDARRSTTGNTQYDVYAQRINQNGAVQWTADGIPISAANNNPQVLFPQIVSNGSGGAFIVWQDKRSGTWEMYAQKVDAVGSVQWTSNGMPVSTTGASQQYLSPPLSDGTGGVIITWESSKDATTDSDVYAQRINSSGEVLWGDAGKVVSRAPNDQRYLQMTTDGAGGAIIVWEDYRVSSASRDIYAQRIDDSGSVLWTDDGVAISTAQYSQFEPRIVSDGSGGAIITWYDYRNYNEITGSGNLQGIDVYAQRVDKTGTGRWTADGTPISTTDLHQMYPRIASDGEGGAIIVWEDQRSGTQVDIYAQGISPCGRQ